jgi:hypothetical protein
MGSWNYEDLKRHIGHDIHCVGYGVGHEFKDDPPNVAVECWTCNEVLLDFDKPRSISMIRVPAGVDGITELQKHAIKNLSKAKDYEIAEDLETMSYAEAALLIRKLNKIGQDSEDIT